MVETVGVQFVAKSVTGFIQTAQPVLVVVRHCVIAIEIVVTADTKMFYTDELCHMVEMVEQSFDVGRLLIRNKIPDSGNTHHAAFFRHLTDCFVRLAARSEEHTSELQS